MRESNGVENTWKSLHFRIILNENHLNNSHVYCFFVPIHFYFSPFLQMKRFHFIFIGRIIISLWVISEGPKSQLITSWISFADDFRFNIWWMDKFDVIRYNKIWWIHKSKIVLNHKAVVIFRCIPYTSFVILCMHVKSLWLKFSIHFKKMSKVQSFIKSDWHQIDFPLGDFTLKSKEFFLSSLIWDHWVGAPSSRLRWLIKNKLELN